jgi:hypothetical protein
VVTPAYEGKPKDKSLPTYYNMGKVSTYIVVTPAYEGKPKDKILPTYYNMDKVSIYRSGDPSFLKEKKIDESFSV